MLERQHNPVIIMSQWRQLVSTAALIANTAAQSCRAEFGDLALSEARKFTEQGVPESSDELSNRINQLQRLGGKIDSIKHAAFLANTHPTKASEILNELRAFCNEVSLTDDVAPKSLRLYQKVWDHCH